MNTPAIDWDACIGCGACAEVCPEVFKLREDKAWIVGLDRCNSCDCRTAAEICPVRAITLEEE